MGVDQGIDLLISRLGLDTSQRLVLGDKIISMEASEILDEITVMQSAW